MKCDSEGVPELIQEMRYLPYMMAFEVLFFNGRSEFFDVDRVCPSIGLMQNIPDNMQMLEAENNITKLSNEFFNTWWPHENLHS